ncbi:hypothetical protein DPMN_169912 [Dreissena polymorpha]|uniref:Uncharacterized protein n=1 Tax=Dreissena polymorpha TaxID=45954 RepID=A0A9D4IE34_DREPO|nr:hypothetical protein DPMN_169912 [Dreissena polymorpha]
MNISEKQALSPASAGNGRPQRLSIKLSMRSSAGNGRPQRLSIKVSMRSSSSSIDCCHKNTSVEPSRQETEVRHEPDRIKEGRLKQET